MSDVTRDYPIIGLSHAFSPRLVTVEEVPELVPWIVCEGGPQDGWVYDQSTMERRENSSGEGLTYEYAGVIVGLPDGHAARLFQFVVKR